MTDAPETDASFLAPVSGACVRGIRDESYSSVKCYTSDLFSLLSYVSFSLYALHCYAQCKTRKLQGGHKPGKPAILGNFSEHGKLA